MQLQLSAKIQHTCSLYQLSACQLILAIEIQSKAIACTVLSEPKTQEETFETFVQTVARGR